MQNDELQLPPHSVDAEHAVLGSLMQNNAAFDSIADLISERDFYRDDHRRIFRAIMTLIEASKQADVITVLERLKVTGDAEHVGGLAYLGAITRNTPSGNARRFAEIVRDHRIARDLMAAAAKMHELAHQHGDIGKRLEEAQSLIANLHEGTISDEPILIHDFLVKVIEDVDQRFHGGGEMFGLSSGLVDIDKMTGGFQKGDLVIIAGRPSMGKSALGVQIAQHVAMNEGKAALIFSLEMSGMSLAQRAISNVGRVNSDALRTGKLRDEDWPRLTTAVGKLNDAPILIDQASSPSVTQMRAKARRANRKHELGVILVDYIQLMSGKGDNRNEEVSSITRGLKLLAQELDVPVIALSQLSRKCEERADKRPLMSDLRESGAIEQDADVIMFVYRDDYYTKEKCLNPGVAEILFRKQRNGPTGDVLLTWSGEYTRFDNFAGHFQRDITKATRRGFDG